MNYLPHTAEEYHRAVKYFKQLMQLAKEEPEQGMIAMALEALRYAALRKENPPLTWRHLKEMHGQPVYCGSVYGGQTGGGIVDARKGAVILLDHDRVWRDTWEWYDGRRYFRFPLNGVDLLTPERKG